MRIPDLEEIILPGIEAAMMLAEAQAVIAMRLAGLAGLWPLAPMEHLDMVTEKVEAIQASVLGVMAAGMAGAAGPQMAMAAISPLRAQTRANARRLMGHEDGV